jgi:protein tyrosine phosphatase (PTP) superfamily phosphohydrolase (DUF442 family)
MPHLPALLIVSLVCGAACARRSASAPEGAVINAVRSDSTASSSVKDAQETAVERKPEKLFDDAHLHNVFRLHAKVLSGGQPLGDEGFVRLAELGVNTIISVDGATPEVEMAARHGMRYVHLPHGYDGIPEERAKELAKAVRDLPGPVYIHCHHGKHRSPTAAAVACVAAGLIEPTFVLGFLDAAGTSHNYKGLYAAALSARPLNEQFLDQLKVDFKSSVDIGPLAEAMVAIEHTHDHLKQIAQNKWRTPAAHPDLDPAHEALMLREQFVELLRTLEVQSKPNEFQRLAEEAAQIAQKLEETYRRTGQSHQADEEALNRSLDAVARNCAACHRKFRDVPR